MNFLDRAILSLFPGWGAARLRNRYIARSFTGADLDRLRNRASYQNLGPKTENRQSRERLLNVARDLDRNNSYAHGAFNSIVANVIGSGIRMEAQAKTRAGKPLETVNRQVEATWGEFVDACDIEGRRSFYEIQRLVERELWVAGEILIARVVPRDKRPIPLALEVIESERLAPIDREVGNNRVIQGVEYAPSGAIVAYHVYENHPSDSLTPQEPKAIPASRVLHLFHMTRPGQSRGHSQVACVARNFEAIGQYMDHELTRARVASSFALMIKRGGMSMAPKFPSSGDASATYDDNDLPTDANSNPLGYLEGGMIFTGGPNDSIEGTGPAIHAHAFAEFISTNLRAIATGMNISYELLARDFTQTNFSSARQSYLEDGRHWRPRQEFLAGHLNNPVFQWFTDACIMAGRAPFVGSWRKIRADWVTPPREYVNPVDEVNADILALRENLTNYPKICARHGTDARDNIRINAEIRQIATDAGLPETAALDPAQQEAMMK